MAALRDALAEVVVEDFEEAFTMRLPLPRTLHGSKIWPIVFSQGSCFFSGLQPTFPIGFTMDFLPANFDHQKGFQLWRQTGLLRLRDLASVAPLCGSLACRKGHG